VVVLDRGTTVLLVTDGVIERRGGDLDEEMTRLRGAASALADRPLPELCDELVDRGVHGRPEDDVALVAIRLLHSADPNLRRSVTAPERSVERCVYRAVNCPTSNAQLLNVEQIVRNTSLAPRGSTCGADEPAICRALSSRSERAHTCLQFCRAVPPVPQLLVP
jgi:hypothetical protein